MILYRFIPHILFKIGLDEGLRLSDRCLNRGLPEKILKILANGFATILEVGQEKKDHHNKNKGKQFSNHGPLFTRA